MEENPKNKEILITILKGIYYVKESIGSDSGWLRRD